MKKLSLMIMVALVALFVATSCADTPSKTTEQPHAQPNMNAEVLEPYECGDVTRLNTLGGVFLASQPQPSDIEQAAKGGIKLVVNMRHESENKAFDERKVVEANGMRYINLPWNGADELTDKVINEGRRILREETRPMMMHCSSANRAGAIWFAYRVLDNGITVDAALAEAKTVGMKTPAYEPIIKKYIAKNQK